MKAFIFRIICLLGVAANVAAADFKWPPQIAAAAMNQVGGMILLEAKQDKPCIGEWYNAASNRVSDGKVLHGCWKFTAAHVTIAWEDQTTNEYALGDFQWADWVQEGAAKPAKPSGPAPRITPHKGDIIS